MSEEEITLKEIREALRMADEKRLDPQLSEKQRGFMDICANRHNGKQVINEKGRFDVF
jgi:hypothetical protein